MNTDTTKISEALAHQKRLPHTLLSAFTRTWFQRLLRLLSWTWFFLMGVVVVNVAMRYLMGEGRIEFEEIQWHLYSVGFLIGMATCMDSDQHVRVDLFHGRMSLRQQAWVELYGLLLLFFPFVIAMLIFSVPFVTYSWDIAEVSDAPGGLPYRWLIKSFLPMSMLLLLAAALSRLSRITAYLFGWPDHVD